MILYGPLGSILTLIFTKIVSISEPRAKCQNQGRVQNAVNRQTCLVHVIFFRELKVSLKYIGKTE